MSSKVDALIKKKNILFEKQKKVREKVKALTPLKKELVEICTEIRSLSRQISALNGEGYSPGDIFYVLPEGNKKIAFKKLMLRGEVCRSHFEEAYSMYEFLEYKESRSPDDSVTNKLNDLHVVYLYKNGKRKSMSRIWHAYDMSKFFFLKFDDAGRLHCNNGPAASCVSGSYDSISVFADKGMIYSVVPRQSAEKVESMLRDECEAPLYLGDPDLKETAHYILENGSPWRV